MEYNVYMSTPLTIPTDKGLEADRKEGTKAQGKTVSHSVRDRLEDALRVQLREPVDPFRHRKGR